MMHILRSVLWYGFAAAVFLWGIREAWRGVVVDSPRRSPDPRDPYRYAVWRSGRG